MPVCFCRFHFRIAFRFGLISLNCQREETLIARLMSLLRLVRELSTSLPFLVSDERFRS